MNSRIRVARGTDPVINSKSYADVVGHPLYNIDKKYLYIGDGTTQIKHNEPITTNRIEGWTESTDFSVPDYTIYGETNGLLLKQTGDKYIKFNVNNKDIFQINKDGIVIAENDRNDIKFIGNLQGNADTATTATNATNADIITVNDNVSSATISFKIGEGTPYTKTIDNVANSERAQYYITAEEVLTSATSTLAPFTWYKASDSISNLEITTYTSSNKTDVKDEWFLKFTAGDNPSIKLGNVSYANGWAEADYESGNIYTIYIIDGVAYVSVIEPNS